MRGTATIRASVASTAAAVAIIGCGGEDKREPIPLASVKTAAERVEKLRGLEFRRLPKVQKLDRAGVRSTFGRIFSTELLRLEEAGRLEGLKRTLAASSQLLLLTETIDPKGDPRKARTEDVTSIAGAYEPSRNTVYLRRRAVLGGGRAGNEVLAHELTHALEEQTLGSRPGLAEPLAESTGGRKALVEGSATLSEIVYAQRHLGERRSVDEVLDERERDAEGPGFTRALATSQSFPYVAGARFAQALHRRAEGSWRLVDRAHRRPPVSTEQILHPDKWVTGERPVRVTIPRRPPLERSLRSVGGGELGELDTGIVLRTGVSEDEAARAASGWGGGAFAVWQRGKGPDPLCPPPCRQRFAALMAWRWDSESDAREAQSATKRYVDKALRPRSGGNGSWRLEEGAVAVAGSRGGSSLAFAPTVRAARALAATGVR